ncbi:hypothetical protein QTP86_031039, partial [Hemibagrus guttatus]
MAEFQWRSADGALRLLCSKGPDCLGWAWPVQVCPGSKRQLYYSFIVYRLSDLFSGHGEPAPISGVIGYQGRIHPGRSANPSQGTHTLSHSLTQSHTTDNLEMPINLQCMPLDRGGNRSTQRKSPRHGENMQTPHTHMAEVGIKPPTLE